MGFRKKSTKTPPILSHEFVIQNHADILSCVLMIFIVALYFQISAKFGSTFITLNHNITINKTIDSKVVEDYSFFKYGLKDICFVFFYFIACIIYHAVIQEWILDRANRRLHLSKVKTNKFNESGGLLTFYIPMLIFGIYILANGHLSQIHDLWLGYPHVILPWITKIFFLIQISAWLHFYPELYFQKIPKEDWISRCTYPTLYLAFITTAYLLNFTKIALVLLILQYFEQSLYHAIRIVHFCGKKIYSKYGFAMWNVVFVLSRLLSLIFLVLTFHYGLAKTNIPLINFQTLNFNTAIIRYNCLATFGVLQAWLMWSFVTFHLSKMSESGKLKALFAPVTKKTKINDDIKKKKASKGKGSELLPNLNNNQVDNLSNKKRI